MEIVRLIRNFATIKKFPFPCSKGTNGISLRKQSALYGRYGPLSRQERENRSKLPILLLTSAEISITFKIKIKRRNQLIFCSCTIIKLVLIVQYFCSQVRNKMEKGRKR